MRVRPARHIAYLGLALALGSRADGGQVTPPVRDTTRDTTKVTALPGMRTESSRIERQMFDDKPQDRRHVNLRTFDFSAMYRVSSILDLGAGISLLRFSSGDPADRAVRPVNAAGVYPVKRI